MIPDNGFAERRSREDGGINFKSRSAALDTINTGDENLAIVQPLVVEPDLISIGIMER
jgi:hypothetical protein